MITQARSIIIEIASEIAVSKSTQILVWTILQRGGDTAPTARKGHVAAFLSGRYFVVTGGVEYGYVSIILSICWGQTQRRVGLCSL